VGPNSPPRWVPFTCRFPRGGQSQPPLCNLKPAIHPNPAAAINHSLHYIHRLTEGARHPGLTPVNALSAALDIEQALLENRYFEVFTSDSAGIQRLLQLLIQSTRAHIERVRAAWQNHTTETN
jgi:hypothetical protein